MLGCIFIVMRKAVHSFSEEFIISAFEHMAGVEIMDPLAFDFLSIFKHILFFRTDSLEEIRVPDF